MYHRRILRNSGVETMKVFQKDIKSKLKNLLAIAAVITTYGIGRHISNDEYEQKLQNRIDSFAKSEAAYKEKIKILEAAKKDFRFYDFDRNGIRNSLIDSLNSGKFVPEKPKDYEQFRLFVPQREEINGVYEYMKKHKFPDMDNLLKQRKLLIHNINTCPDDSTDLFFRSCQQYHGLLKREMGALKRYLQGVDGLFMLKMPRHEVKARQKVVGERMEKRDNMYSKMLDFAEYAMLEDILAIRQLTEINNNMIDTCRSKDSIRQVEARKLFYYKKSQRRAEIADSLYQDAKKKEITPLMRIQALAPWRRD